MKLIMPKEFSCQQNGDGSGVSGPTVAAAAKGPEDGDEACDTLSAAITPPLASLRQLLQPKLKLDLKTSYEYKPKR